MKKGLGVLLMILVVVLGALLKAITGSFFGSTEGFIERIPGSIILCGLFFLGWSLFKSTDKSSTHEEVFGYDFTAKTEHKSSSNPKEYTNVPKEAFNSNKESIVEQIDEVKVSNDISQLTEIEKIERLYEKGIFTEQEKNDLINKIFKEKQNDELEKIKENYNSVLDPYRDKFLEIYSIEYVELEDLHNQGIIDEKTLKSKLEILKINIAKRIQKEIRFKSIKGFEVYQGLEIKNGCAVGVIVEIINSKEIRAQLNWDSTLSVMPWSIIDITPTGQVKKNIKDWELSKNNFLLQEETANNKLNELKVGDSYKEGEVFFVSNEEVKIIKILDDITSAKPSGYDHNQNKFLYCNFEKLISAEDEFWKVPDYETLTKCCDYLIKNSSYIPDQPDLIWSSEVYDTSTVKCVKMIRNEPTFILSSRWKDHFGVLVRTIKL
jgi:hypothetical protein